MYIGTELWKDIIPEKMVKKTLSSGREIETFANLPNTMYEALENSEKRFPDKYALIDDLGRKFTYSQLKSEVDRFAACLKHRYGIQKKDHVAIMAYSTNEYVTALLALIKIGAVAVILPTKFKEQEIHSLAERSDLKCVICDRKYEPWFKEYRDKGVLMISVSSDSETFSFDTSKTDEEWPQEAAEGKYEDVSVMMFTSGTTSLSKGVLLTNYNFMHAAGAYRSIFHVTEKDVTVIPVPIYTITALSAVLGTFLYAGGTIYLQRIFHADKVLSCIRDHQITYMHAAPTVCNFLLEEKEKFPELPSLKRIVCGGSRMQKQKIEQLHDWLPGCEYHNVYGMTETTSPGTIQPENAVEGTNIASAGIPIPGLIYKVVDDDQNELPSGQTGEIMVSGACIMEGYYKLDTPLYQNGWLDTGDVGYFTEEGYCYLMDRKKDMINRGGEKLTSMDVEDQLYQIDGISEAVVVGIPDEMYGEVPAALVKLQKGAQWDEKGIQQYLKNRLAKYKIPTRIVFTDKIPLTPNGKEDKKTIRKILAQTT